MVVCVFVCVCVCVFTKKLSFSGNESSTIVSQVTDIVCESWAGDHVPASPTSAVLPVGAEEARESRDKVTPMCAIHFLRQRLWNNQQTRHIEIACTSLHGRWSLQALKEKQRHTHSYKHITHAWTQTYTFSFVSADVHTHTHKHTHKINMHVCVCIMRVCWWMAHTDSYSLHPSHTCIY